MVFAFGVVLGPFANQDIKLFCFICSVWGLELGAMVLAVEHSRSEKERKLKMGARIRLFVHVFRSKSLPESDSEISTCVRTLKTS